MGHYRELQGRVVLVTGAARGLGAAIARSFADAGARLTLLDRDGEALMQTANELRLDDERLQLEVADLADPQTHAKAIERTVEAFGGVHVLVNNAAMLKRTPMEDVTLEDFETTLRINLVAPYFLARAAIIQMRRQGYGGRIVNVASMAGRTGGVGDIHPYAASKGGLMAATKSLAKVAAADGILVNCVLPSNIESAMLREVFPPEVIARTLRQVPLGRTADPSEVAELVLWLASDASGYVTGANWDINGGWYMS